jgi:GGDEF domain-containing protein
VSWLQDLLRTEFADAGLAAGAPVPLDAADAGEPSDAGQLAVWRREWLRRWRRLQLPEQLAAFNEALEPARLPEQVHRLLAEHASEIVGAYTCLVFLPGADGRLRPLPDTRVEHAEGLWLDAHAERETALLGPGDVLQGARHAGLGPLFHDTRAVALAFAPYGGGAAVVVERRQEREFEAVDWQLLRALCSKAEAALHRVTLLGGLYAPDPQTGGAARERVDQVLRHGWAGAALGHPITVVLVRLDTEGEDGTLAEPTVQHCAAILRREATGAGPVLRHGAREFLLVLHADPAAAGALVERVRARTGGRVQIRAGIAPHDPAAGSARDLLRRVQATLDASA